jgi:hypothetical protein
MIEAHRRPERMNPLPHRHCPLCGGPNDCAVARCGRFDTECWCRAAVVSPHSLALVQEAQRNPACLCRRCAEEPPAGDMLARSRP